MKNPFVKNENPALAIGIALGTLSAGAAAYLLFTRSGTQARSWIGSRFETLRSSLTRTRKEETQPEHSTDYLHHQEKPPKTDRRKLVNHEILHEHGPQGIS